MTSASRRERTPRPPGFTWVDPPGPVTGPAGTATTGTDTVAGHPVLTTDEGLPLPGLATATDQDLEATPHVSIKA